MPFAKFLFFACALLLRPASAWATTAYSIDFKVTNSNTYGAINVKINYAGANGGFAGSGSTVSCTPNASLNASTAFMDLDSSSQLSAGMIQLNGIAGPAVLFTCTFDSNGGAPSASNFLITIYDWSSDFTTTAPTVQISRIQVQ